MPLGRAPQRFSRRQLVGKGLDLLQERGILGHQPVRREDLRFSVEALRGEPCFCPRELRGYACERGERGLRPSAVRNSNRLGRDEGRADGDTGGDDDAAKPAFGHGSAATASSSARRIRAVEVAPGSWCPMLRSPR